MNRKQNKINVIVKVITIFINVIFCLAFPFSLIVAMVSPMTFDSPSSTKSFYAWVYFLSALSMPVVILISIITSLIFLIRYKFYKTAFVFSLLPIVNFVFILFAFSGN